MSRRLLGKIESAHFWTRRAVGHSVVCHHVRLVGILRGDTDSPVRLPPLQFGLKTVVRFVRWVWGEMILADMIGRARWRIVVFPVTLMYASTI